MQLLVLTRFIGRLLDGRHWKMPDAEPRAVATGCQHSSLKAARALYFIVDRNIRSLPLAVLHLVSTMIVHGCSSNLNPALAIAHHRATENTEDLQRLIQTRTLAGIPGITSHLYEHRVKHKSEFHPRLKIRNPKFEFRILKKVIYETIQ